MTKVHILRALKAIFRVHSSYLQINQKVFLRRKDLLSESLELPKHFFSVQREKKFTPPKFNKNSIYQGIGAPKSSKQSKTPREKFKILKSVFDAVKETEL